MPKQVNARCRARFPARHTGVNPDVGSQLKLQALPKCVSLRKHFNKFLFGLLSCSDGWLSVGSRGRLPAYGQGAGEQAKFLWPTQSLSDSGSQVRLSKLSSRHSHISLHKGRWEENPRFTVSVKTRIDSMFPPPPPPGIFSFQLIKRKNCHWALVTTVFENF